MTRSHIVLRVGSFPTRSETFVRQQAELIQELGYSLTILAERASTIPGKEASDTKSLELLSSCKELGRLDHLGRKDHLRDRWSSIMRFGLKTTLKYSELNAATRGSSTGMPSLAVDALKGTDNADIYHIQFGSFQHPLTALKSVGILKGEVICTFHGYDGHFTESDKVRKQAEYVDLFKVARFITANTLYLGEKLIKLGCPREKLRIIPMSVDTDFFHPLEKKPSQSPCRLISVGRLIPLKGFDLAIRSIRQLRGLGFDFQYDIIGDGPEKEHLRSKIESADLGGHVRLLEGMPPKDVRDRMQNADICIVPSTVDADGRHEAQGLVALEAQACGVPVVAFQSGGVPYTVDHDKSGLLVPEGDTEAMTQAIGSLLADNSRMKAMGDHGRRMVERRFSYAGIKSKWTQLYDETMAV